MSDAAPSATPPRVSRLRLVLGGLLNLLLTFVVLGFAWGDPREFARDAWRDAAVVLGFLPTLAYAATSRTGAGVRSVDEGRRFVMLANVLAAVVVIVAVWIAGHGARGFLVLPGGEALRIAGVAVMLIGTVLRAGAMLRLGRRFSLKIALQQGHTLETRGLYARIRHPSYAGQSLMLLGLAMTFRSTLLLIFAAVLLEVTIRRISREERFLAEQFGDEWRAYAARTQRLVPGVW